MRGGVPKRIGSLDGSGWHFESRVLGMGLVLGLLLLLYQGVSCKHDFLSSNAPSTHSTREPSKQMTRKDLVVISRRSRIDLLYRLHTPSKLEQPNPKDRVAKENNKE
jgi:hypothetical protein